MRTLTGTGGSNPSLSAILKIFIESALVAWQNQGHATKYFWLYDFHGAMAVLRER